MEMIFLTLSVSSILVMLYALYSALVLRNKVHGQVRSTWNFLTILILFFTIGYLATPFFHLLSQESKDILVGVIFLSGALFVVVVVKLFYKIVEVVGL